MWSNVFWGISHGGGLFSSRICVFPGFTPFAKWSFEEMRGLKLHESGFCKLYLAKKNQSCPNWVAYKSSTKVLKKIKIL